MASNPVIRRFDNESRGNNPPPSPVDLQKMYDQPAYAGPRNYPPTGYLTLDGVVQRTAAMLATVFVAGAITWIAVPESAYGAALIIGLLGGFGLAMYMAFTMRANAVTALLYAAFEGVALGAISEVFNQQWPGIVIQAVAGTAMVAAGMLFVYRIGAIRVTPRFTRILVGGMIGVLGLIVINAIAYLFTPNGLGLNSGGPVAVIFTLVCIALAAFNLVYDFDMIERGIRNGAPAKFAWYAAFGLTVTLVWLYLEILRLLGYARR
ncbi:Bax inhibitor-1/YccA family protein [Jatrophihabitans endophyticus]|uniref:Bax inhibitor-1/YccA family protein n=1 Tax=Jatrophihabitans endophyticus TaxID=1206085 RepID=UPI001A02BDDE|nr:Bax inhibitor-1/YccA family protein [Jatrophihabitans endophyticus]MBE7188629.1 Bax inhibitor-1/YccA family protein [Jatrophihabitans endophyticus]